MGRISPLLILVFSLIFPTMVAAAPCVNGYTQYSQSQKTCVVSGPACDEFGSVEFGWQKQGKDYYYYGNCHNWDDLSCCYDICQIYNEDNKKCVLDPAILSQLKKETAPGSPNLSIAIGAIVVVLVIIATYFVVGIISVVYFLIRG